MAERRSYVMGSDAHVLVCGTGDEALSEAEERLRDLERRWSRFLPDSELNRLNASAPTMMGVSTDTAWLIELATIAWSRTGGRFDPTVGPALAAAGYDRSFELLADHCSSDEVEATASGRGPTPGCAGIATVPGSWLVRLPSGTALDAGGIGKGLAADLVAGELVDAGATASLVSIGGDLRVAGAAPPGGWQVAVDHDAGGPVWRIALVDGAIATSSVLRRRWNTGAGSGHHVIDPRSGRPTTEAALACTVVAGEAWWAEALATAILVAWEEPDGREVAAELVDGAAALITTADGDVVRVGDHHVVWEQEKVA